MQHTTLGLPYLPEYLLLTKGKNKTIKEKHYTVGEKKIRPVAQVITINTDAAGGASWWKEYFQHVQGHGFKPQKDHLY